MSSDLFDPGVWDFTIGIQNISTSKNDVWVALSSVWKLGANQLPASFLESISLMDEAAADARIVEPTTAGQGFWMRLDPGASADVSFHVTLGQSAFLYLSLLDDVGRSYLVTHGATLVGERTNSGQGTTYKSKVWRITNTTGGSPDTHLACVQGICTRVPGSDPDSCSPEGSACVVVSPPPSPPPNVGLPPPLVLETCILPTPSLNFIQLMTDLISYLSCILKNIILYLEWIVTTLAYLVPKALELLVYILTLQWLTDFISQFFAQLDIWLSAKFGIDPSLPFFEELVRKALNWIGGALDAAAENRMKIRGWK